MATDSSILAWKIPWTEKSDKQQSMGLQKKWTQLSDLVQFSHSLVSDSVTPWSAALQANLSITNSWSLLKFMSIELVMPCNHLILCYPLLLPSILPSMSLFQLVSSSHQVASASVLPMTIQDWLPLGWTGLISLQFKGLSIIFSNTTVQKHQFISTQLSL